MKHTLKLSSKGFTLTEILLAVMIIGLIGVSLAALTRASAREGGVGRSRIMLRNNADIFMRTLRHDIEEATEVTYLAGSLVSPSTAFPGTTRLLKLKKGVSSAGTAIPLYASDGTLLEEATYTEDGSALENTPRYIVYCFQKGSDNENIVPTEATRGGTIYRIDSTDANADCNSTFASDQKAVLKNVKFISDSTDIQIGTATVSYPVPFFGRNSFGTPANSLIDVRIITELNSNPIVNDLIEETFAAPLGY